MQTWKFELGNWTNCPELDGLSRETTAKNDWVEISHGFQLSSDIVKVRMDSTGSKFVICPSMMSYRYPSHEKALVGRDSRGGLPEPDVLGTRCPKANLWPDRSIA
jgi:hypothetical protein